MAGDDVFGVNPKFFRQILPVFFIGLALLTCGAKPHVAPTVVPLGNNTFSITRQASNGFSRDTDRLKSEVSEDAAQYCSAQGKKLKVVSLTADKPFFAMGYASAKIVFRAVGADDPELSAAPASAVAIEKPSPTGDLYSDLLKLDDLRKKGILTEDEFQTEKKKVLSRSQ